MGAHCYPTLTLIDRALPGSRPPFAEAADGGWLERLARALADEFWGETAWLTGRVPEAAFRSVCDALEGERTPVLRGAATAG